jgi:tRNA(fMet)-specific endonuclease VapC
VRYLLDTNICIAWMKGDPHVKERILALTSSDIAICSIVKAELYYGVLKGRVRHKAERSFRSFVQPLTSLAFDDQVYEKYAVLRATIEHQGTPIGPYDLMIAAIAEHYGLTLVTRNLREFQRIPSLSIEAW